ncbi:MAG: Fe-S cluster domain-containing protein [Candidatus Undinarchaeales archaeon]|jgi:electron transport complex protein RnfB|nr:Fe-S cluster domain-containing protein [Candidatus Undinarchaeales archaeon]MDP7492944.1 Fe-S cluster domain-containing protein [Candidatus Undinarchaeales archaeon]
MVEPVVAAIAVMGALGFIFGIGLSFASKAFHVETDPRVDQVRELLAGANCGACGLAGCDAFSEAVVAGSTAANGCTPGGTDVAEKIGEIMGAEVEVTEPQIAVNRCRGAESVCGLHCVYEGIECCSAAALVGTGPKKCSYGCIALGDCVEACKFDALTFGEGGIPHVITENCVGCGACIKACPKGLFELVPKNALVHVLCSSHDPGKVVGKLCKVGCIACRICERACPVDAIHVVDELAVIDYEKCTECGACAEKCPKKCIEDRRPADEIEASSKERAEKAAKEKAAKLAEVKKKMAEKKAAKE